MFKGKDYPERKILELADYMYVNLSLKPISKIIFLVSRILLVLNEFQFKTIPDKGILLRKYDRLCKKYGFEKLGSDYIFSEIIDTLGSDYEKILETTQDIFQIAKQYDTPEAILETLLRGRYEAGEGLGTHLTPEEVVKPIAGICKQIQFERFFEDSTILVGDISAGTGRFIEPLLDELQNEPAFKPFKIKYFLADHSNFTLELGKIHFLLKKKFKSGVFQPVIDSITDNTINSYKGKFDILLTNPPFGNTRYLWNEALSSNFPQAFLSQIGMKKENSSIDPAELFFFKNLELLKVDGLLGIILPDGILYSDKFRKSVTQYESISGYRLSLRALISLPSRTFSLGGTIVKTSCLLLQKTSPETPISHSYYAEARHIGFIKRGNFRVADPEGNDLENFRDEFVNRQSHHGKWKKLQKFSDLSPTYFTRKVRSIADREKVLLGDIAEIAKETDRYHKSEKSLLSFHVSVPDIGPLGIIDLYRARKNSPGTHGWVCLPGDILISCINPQIWRFAVVPVFLQAKWVCSPEIAVLRIMRKDVDPYNVFLALLEADVSNQLNAMPGGTSATNQHAKKEDVLQISISLELGRSIEFTHFRERRNSIYADIWNEILELT